jgi:predicted phage terminase large subunit-like protein
MNSGDLRELVRDDPLAHPLAFQLRNIPHECAPPPHLREMMGAVFRGLSNRYPSSAKKIARLYPREHGKSQTGATDIPAWKVCDNPNVRILLMSETAAQAKDIKGQLEGTLGVEDGEVLEGSVADEHGLEVKQHTRKKLTFGREAAHREPTVRAAGFDTGVTGGHYDLLVFDDVVSWKTQRTEARRQKAWQQFSDYSQNLGSEGDSVYLVLGTRKHPEDIYSRMAGSFGWDVVVEPAISDWSIVENRDFSVETQQGEVYGGSELGDVDPKEEVVTGVRPHRDVEVLWSERYPLETLLGKYVGAMGMEGEGTLIWKRENQNDPEALMGQVLGEDMLHFSDELPGGPPLNNDRLEFYAGVDVGIEDDPARAAANDADYWAVAIAGHDYRNGTTYVVEAKRRRGMTLQKGINWVQAAVREYDPAQVMVESNQAQRWFVQTARDEGLNFQQSSSSGSKDDRIISMSSRFESGKVRLYDRIDNGPHRSDEWRGFISEWAAFPTGAHDDRLDAVEILLRAIGSEDISASKRSLSDLPVG